MTPEAGGRERSTVAAALTVRPARFHLRRPAAAGLVAGPPTGGVEPCPPHRVLPHPASYRPVEPATVAVYRLTVNGRTQVGVVAEVAVADYDGGRVRPHEATRPHVVHALVEQLERSGVDLCPVTLAFPADAGLGSAITDVLEAAPDLQVVGEDGAEHTVWVLDPERAALLTARLSQRPALYVVDGHHRCAAGSRLAAGRSGTGPDSTGAEYLFAFLVPAEHLEVTSFHVVVRGVALRPWEIAERVGQQLGATGQVVGPAAVGRTRPGTISMWCDDRWYRFRSVRRDPAGDAALLQSAVLGPVFGIVRPAEDARLEHVPGTVAPHDLGSRCTDGTAAFVLHPPSVASLLATADAGTSVPPKSSFFHPKIPAGLFVRSRR